MEALIGDLRHAVRSLRRTLGFTATVVLILGLGIGMATAVFTVYHAVLLRRLPVRDQDRLMVLWGAGRGSSGQLPLAYSSYLELRDGSRTLSAVAGYEYAAASALPMHYGGTILSIYPQVVTGNFFQTLGTQPFLGRLLRPSDDVPGAAPVVVLSYEAWQRLFSGDRDAIGRRLTFSGDSLNPVIVGVAAPGLDFPAGTDAWFPLLAIQPNAASDSAYVGVFVVGRLALGATGAQARSEFLGVLHRERTNLPDITHQQGAAVQPLPELLLGDVRPALVALAAAAALILILACTNVGNLLLVRAAGRRHEMAIRRALGAGYAHVMRQFLAESAVLGLLGGVVGLLLATVFVRAFLALAPAELPRLDTIHAGVGSALIAAGVTLMSTVLFGLAPVLRGARSDMASPLRSGTRGSGSGRSARLARNVLVSWQVALAVVVLAGAGLVTRSLEQLQHLDLGYRPQGMAVADLDWPWSTYPTAEQSRDPMERIVERVEALPGVIAATPVHRPPFAGSIAFPGVFIAEGESPSDPRSHSYVNVELAGRDYFRTFGLTALLLAAIGLYAITATAVRQQTHELGVRIALGATSGHIRRLVLGRVFWLVGIGTAGGLVAAVAGAGLLRSMLFDVSPTDPVTLTAVCLLLLIVSLVAAYLPTRRATLVDPVQALRAE